jgi:hypothetical protein
LPPTFQENDVAVAKRADAQGNVTAHRAAEDKARAAVEAVRPDGSHGTTALASTWGPGHLNAEQLL